MEVEVVGWGFKESPFYLFLPALWKTDLMVGAPAAILGLGTKDHTNCRAFAMLSLGLNHCQEPPSLDFFYMRTNSCVEATVVSSLYNYQPNTIPSFFSYNDTTIYAVDHGRNLGSSPLFVSSMPTPTIPWTYPVTMYCQLYLLISLVAASSCSPCYIATILVPNITCLGC